MVSISKIELFETGDVKSVEFDAPVEPQQASAALLALSHWRSGKLSVSNADTALPQWLRQLIRNEMVGITRGDGGRTL